MVRLLHYKKCILKHFVCESVGGRGGTQSGQAGTPCCRTEERVLLCRGRYGHAGKQFCAV